MSGPQFHETQMGRRFYEHQLPRLIDGLHRLADGMANEGVGRLEKMQDEDKSPGHPMPDSKYVKASGHCPYCHSDQIEGGAADFEGNDVFQVVSCLSCEKTWTDQYALLGYQGGPR